MISLVVIADDGSHRTEWFQKPEVTIGRLAHNDVVLPASSVSKRHARIVLKDGKYILVDLKSANGTFVNTRRLTSPLVIRETDQIYIGSFRLQVVAYDASAADDDDTAKVEVVELRLLANIASHEPGAREVYADWLDENGDPVRAEYVRLFDQLSAASGRTRDEHVARLRLLGTRLDPEWRIKLARPPIEQCPRAGVDCPGDWGELTGARVLALRSCARCQRPVHYCTDVETAAKLAGPIVVDVACDRQLAETRPPRPRHRTQPGIGPRTLPPVDPPLEWRAGRGCGDVPD